MKKDRCSLMPTPRRVLKDERGASIVIIAICMLALLSAVALAIDVGMLLNARSEAQRAADSAALAGAGSLITVPDDQTRARNIAIQFGEMNTVRGIQADLLDEDIEIDMGELKVTATVKRISQR